MAARRLVCGETGSPCDADALAAFGIPASVLPPPTTLDLWPENGPIVEVFCGMETQWIYSPRTGRPLGLRYEVIETVRRGCGIPQSDHRRIFAGLRVMERAVLEIINHGH